MKVITRTTHTYTVDVNGRDVDLNLNLPHKPSGIMDYLATLLRVADGKITVGYLADDPDCESPADTDDYFGHIYEVHKHSPTLRKYCEALGLTSSGEPNLELVDEDEVIKEAQDRILATPQLRNAALEECACTPRRPGETDDELIVRCLDTLDELSQVLNVEGINEEMWRAGRANGTIGNPYAVLLDVYEHGGIAYSVSGTGMQSEFDTARGGAVWVPSKACLDELRIVPEAQRRAAVAEWARSAAKEYTAWCNGDCYGVVVATYEMDGTYIDHDSCWGFIGGEYAYSALGEDFFPEEAT